MRVKQAATIVICIAIVTAAYAAWYWATQDFNPRPSAVALDTRASCSQRSPPCPAFKINSVTLNVRIAEDITSQELTLNISAIGPSEISRLSVFFASVPIGNLPKEVPPGQSATATWAIPTTLNVTIGSTYVISVRAQYVDPSSGLVAAQYWSSNVVVAA